MADFRSQVEVMVKSSLDLEHHRYHGVRSFNRPALLPSFCHNSPHSPHSLAICSYGVIRYIINNCSSLPSNIERFGSIEGSRLVYGSKAHPRSRTQSCSRGDSGYVAVGMGFQTVVAWQTFELRRSHQVVQPAAPALGINY